MYSLKSITIIKIHLKIWYGSVRIRALTHLLRFETVEWNDAIMVKKKPAGVMLIVISTIMMKDDLITRNSTLAYI